MEASLSPLQKIHRRFAAGRPPNLVSLSALTAVKAASDQLARLKGIIEREGMSEDAEVKTSALVVRALDLPGGLADTILVVPGKESETVALLESYPYGYVVAGLMFAVLNEGKMALLTYLIERTPEGAAALKWSFDRQMSGLVKNQQT